MYVLKCRGNASKTEKERKKNSQVCRWPAVGKPEITCQQIPGLPMASQAVGKMTITLPMAGRRKNSLPTTVAVAIEIPKKTLCRWPCRVSRRQSRRQPDGASADVAPLPIADVAIGKALPMA